MIKKLLHLVSFSIFTFFVGLLCLVSVAPLNTFAADYTCTVPKEEIKWWSLATPTKFLPIIPDSCSKDGNSIKPASLNAIPAIILRAYGFLCGLAFYLLTPLFAYYGIIYILGGVSSGQTESAKKALQNAFIAIIILSLFYTIVFAALGILGNTTSFESLSLTNFFSL